MLAKARLRLPIRYKGGGLLCLVDSAPSFFAGAVLRSLPSFIDRRHNGVTLPGLYNDCLGGLFGAGSFDGGLDFSTFTDPATASPLAVSFTSAWNSLRRMTTEGVLGELVAKASGTQHVLSNLLHNAKFEALQSTVDEGLVFSQRDRILFGQIDDFSSIFLKVLPDSIGRCSPLEWVEIASQYFFLPSSAISSFVGQPIMERRGRGGAAVICDEFGDKLQGIPLPFDGYRRQHDDSKNALAEICRLAGVPVQTELLNIFKSVIPPANQAAFAASQNRTTRTSQGIVPDIKIRLQNENGGSGDVLGEVKTLHFGTTTYSFRGAGPRSVDLRALKIQPELEAKLRKADQKHCGAPVDGPPGPMLSRLRSFGPVKGLVFGCIGEVSEDVKSVLYSVSRAAGQEFLRRQPSANRSINIGNGAWYAKRRLAMVGLRARANLLLDRIQFLGPGAKAAYERSQARPSSFDFRSRCFHTNADRARADDRAAHQHFSGRSFGSWAEDD